MNFEKKEQPTFVRSFGEEERRRTEISLDQNGASVMRELGDTRMSTSTWRHLKIKTSNQKGLWSGAMSATLAPKHIMQSNFSLSKSNVCT